MVCFQFALCIHALLCVWSDESDESTSILGCILSFIEHIFQLESIWKHFEVSGVSCTNRFLKLFQKRHTVQSLWSVSLSGSSSLWQQSPAAFRQQNYSSGQEVSVVLPRRVLVDEICRWVYDHKKHRSWPYHSSYLPLEVGSLKLK